MIPIEPCSNEEPHEEHYHLAYDGPQQYDAYCEGVS